MTATAGPLSRFTVLDLTRVRSPEPPCRASPDRGEHSDEVLAEFGFSAAERAALVEAGVV